MRTNKGIDTPLFGPTHDVICLIASFPVMAGCLSTLPEWGWDYIQHPDRLRAIYKTMSPAQRLVIDFALQVWDHKFDWRQLGYRNFNVVEAFACWDAGTQQAAFIQWAKHPFHR